MGTATPPPAIPSFYANALITCRIIHLKVFVLTISDNLKEATKCFQKKKKKKKKKKKMPERLLKL